MLLSKCQNLTLKLLRWLFELEKHFVFKTYNIVSVDKKSCFLYLNGPPSYDITLAKFVIQLHDLAILQLHWLTSSAKITAQKTVNPLSVGGFFRLVTP